MNKSYVLYNLKEAAEQLENIIQELGSDPEYEYGSFVVDMSHLYHHINTAWNAQEESASAVEECSEANFNKWRQMPSNFVLLLES